MPAHLCIYAHLHTYRYIRTPTHSHRHTHSQPHIHLPTYTSTQTLHVCTYTLLHVTHTRARTHTRTRTHARAHTHAHARARTHAHARARTHAHTVYHVALHHRLIVLRMHVTSWCHHVRGSVTGSPLASSTRTSSPGGQEPCLTRPVSPPQFLERSLPCGRYSMNMGWMVNKASSSTRS